MTRIFTDGAEMGDVLFFTVPNTVSAITSTKRSGSYSYDAGNTTFSKTITGLSEFYLRWGFYFTPPANKNLMEFRNGGTALCQVYLTSSYFIEARVNNVAVGTSTGTYLNALWHLIEVHLKIDDSPNGIFQVKINGVLEIDYSGDTKPGAETTIDTLYCSTGNVAYNLDDLALNDTDNSDGKNDNSWCGDGHVVKITPSGSGTVNNWVNSGGVSASANYLYVDEFPYDSDTSYVYVSGSSIGNKDKYAMTSFSKPAGSNIKRIFSQANMRKTNADDTYVKIGYLPLGSTDQLSGSISLTTNYTRITGTSASTNPLTGLEWTESDINDLEYVCEITS